MIDKIDEKTRIKLKFSIKAGFENIITLQRKKWYGWKTTAWIYPSIMKHESCKYIRHWLEWEEKYKKQKPKTEKEIGIELMTRCSDEFLPL